jgi:hypothetical protein
LLWARSILNKSFAEAVSFEPLPRKGRKKMATTVKTATYFYTRVEDKPGQAYTMLAQLASGAINLLAFSAVPYGPNYIELTIFPDDNEAFVQLAKQLNWALTGPQHAFLIQGDDRLGALTGIHQKLSDANINVYASSGVTDGRGRFGYIIYVKESDFAKAAAALGMDSP